MAGCRVLERFVRKDGAWISRFAFLSEGRRGGVHVQGGGTGAGGHRGRRVARVRTNQRRRRRDEWEKRNAKRECARGGRQPRMEDVRHAQGSARGKESRRATYRCALRHAATDESRELLTRAAMDAGFVTAFPVLGPERELGCRGSGTRSVHLGPGLWLICRMWCRVYGPNTKSRGRAAQFYCLWWPLTWIRKGYLGPTHGRIHRQATLACCANVCRVQTHAQSLISSRIVNLWPR